MCQERLTRAPQTSPRARTISVSAFVPGKTTTAARMRHAAYRRSPAPHACLQGGPACCRASALRAVGARSLSAKPRFHPWSDAAAGEARRYRGGSDAASGEGTGSRGRSDAAPREGKRSRRGGDAAPGAGWSFPGESDAAPRVEWSFPCGSDSAPGASQNLGRSNGLLFFRMIRRVTPAAGTTSIEPVL